jgi:sugar transferase (PEP-CTERM/EpsH1 system associated)
MKILFLTSRLPYPVDRGDRNRTYHFLREMAARHDVRLLTFIESETERRGVAPLEALGVEVTPVLHSRWASRAKMMLALPSGRPFQVAYYDSAPMRRLVQNSSADRDVVIAHLIRMAPYLDSLSAPARRIVDFCDCISSEYRASLAFRTGIAKAFYREGARRVSRYERELLGRLDEGWVISPAEIEKIAPDGDRLHVVPIGVPVGNGPRPRPVHADPRLVFTGNMSVPHNVDAACFLVREIFPRILAEIPQARLTIAGAHPAAAVRALAGPNVEVTGWVEDLGALLGEADLFLAPMRYVAGVQTKVLDAMALGVPVLTSDLVRRGIGVTPGEHVLVGARPEEYTEHAVRLIHQREIADRIGAAGRDFVREHFTWQAVVDRLEAP